jgi:hypothetical protein
MKICKICNATEDLIGFRKDRRICNNCLYKKKQEYYLFNRKETREHQNKYRELNRDKINAQKREHYQLNKERLIKNSSDYKKNNRKRYNDLKINRKKNDPLYKLRITVSERIRQALKYHLAGTYKKKDSTIELLGCSIDELKTYLQNQFKEGMTWQNHGEWHIDHIIPCAAFDLSKKEDCLKCFNYKNLQPLWAHENLSKSDKIPIDRLQEIA